MTELEFIIDNAATDISDALSKMEKQIDQLKKVNSEQLKVLKEIRDLLSKK